MATTMRIMMAMRAHAPKTALVMIRSADRSLIGIPHIAYVVFTAARELSASSSSNGVGYNRVETWMSKCV